MIGPVFFLLLDISIRKGVRAAISFDIGVLLSDIIYILIAYLFFSEVQKLTVGQNETIIKILGGFLFLIYGSLTFFKKPKEQSTEEMGSTIILTKDYVVLFLKGFVLNMANPLVIFYWFTVMTLVTKETSDPNLTAPFFIYVATILIVFFSIDFLKIIGAKKLRPFITINVLRSLNRITGTILAIFGIILFLRGVFHI